MKTPGCTLAFFSANSYVIFSTSGTIIDDGREMDGYTSEDRSPIVMRKRIFLIFVIPLFFCLTITLLYLTLNQQKLLAPKDRSIAGQTNFLVLLVNPLADGPTEILSSWAVLVHTGQYPSVIFKQIAPGQLGTQEQSLVTLAGNNLPGENFLQFTETLDLDLNSYFLMDEKALATLISDFTGQTTAVLNETTLTEVCAHLAQGDATPAQKTKWNNLIPAHMRTNLSFETFSTIWDTVNNPDSSLQCKVIRAQSGE